ncbi:hypothetical protein [Microcystis aeruginosa]|nr:hypothetical protein [Microcystis aeruginosa]
MTAIRRHRITPRCSSPARLVHLRSIDFKERTMHNYPPIAIAK